MMKCLVAKNHVNRLIGPINGTVYNLPPIVIAHFLVGMFGGYYRRPSASELTTRYGLATSSGVDAISGPGHASRE